MYLGYVDVAQLNRLGRRLIEVSRAISRDPDDLELTAGQEAVLEDVLRYPASTVTQIHSRTGFTQSHVSASVARLRELGLLDGAMDPTDRRRIRLRASGSTAHVVARRARRSVDAHVVATASSLEEGSAVLELLEQLGELVLQSSTAADAVASTRTQAITDLPDARALAAQPPPLADLRYVDPPLVGVLIRPQLTLDCADPQRLAQFWAAALGYVEQVPAGFRSWPAALAAMGVPEQGWNAVRIIGSAEGGGSRIVLRRVPEPKTTKNRLHLDLPVTGGPEAPLGHRRAQIAAVVERLVDLGAREVRQVQEMGSTWTVLQDPEGNEFCVT